MKSDHDYVKPFLDMELALTRTAVGKKEGEAALSYFTDTPPWAIGSSFPDYY
jgi:hypothetical protein